jgi:hypothetical protein
VKSRAVPVRDILSAQPAAPDFKVAAIFYMLGENNHPSAGHSGFSGEGLKARVRLTALFSVHVRGNYEAQVKCGEWQFLIRHYLLQPLLFELLKTHR